MNVLLLIVDSLRARSLYGPPSARLNLPFFRRLDRETSVFRAAFAAECWTLPSHCSMFTGLLPSEHGAHFQSMAYHGPAPTLAERLSAAGFHTELVSRNPVLDGSIPGITRGFARTTRPLAAARALDPMLLLMALTKPRVRRQLRASGFVHPLQRASRDFVATFARSMIPADHLALAHILGVMAACRQLGRPYFIAANLFDVHAPYPTAPASVCSQPSGWREVWDNLRMPYALGRIGGHRYLQAGFALSRHDRRLLLGRYERAIELMDGKLAAFFSAAAERKLLDETLIIVTSDHGEGFGEHGLYLHDASLYDEHLRVPLWIRGFQVAPDGRRARGDGERSLIGLPAAAIRMKRSVVVFLASDDASYITGAAMYLCPRMSRCRPVVSS